jgi:hypothetical protein
MPPSVRQPSQTPAPVLISLPTDTRSPLVLEIVPSIHEFGLAMEFSLRTGPENGVPAEEWRIHSKGRNLLFEDGHTKWYKGYSTNEMTFRYDWIQGWQ